MSRVGRLSLALAVTTLVSTTTVFAQTAVAAERLWPRIFVIVFERRIPVETSYEGEVGKRLRLLRETVSRLLSDKNGAAPGDHVFVFSDGLSRRDFECALRTINCEQTAIQPPDWSQPGHVAARRFLEYMLRMPGDRLHPSVTRDKTGVEFAHIRWDGQRQSLDCLLAGTVTARMTEAPDGPPDCPIEGAYHREDEARFFSRVELSFPIQFERAVHEARAAGPVSGLTWIWALLREKNFDRESALSGIRVDLGYRARPMAQFFGEAANNYVVRSTRSEGQLGEPRVEIYDVESAATLDLRRLLDASSTHVQVTIGTANLALDGALSISKPHGGSWRPALDSFAMNVTLGSASGGRLLAGALRVESGGRTVRRQVTADGVHLAFPSDPELDAVLQTAKDAASDGPVTTQLTIELLVAPRDESSGFAAIPAIWQINREITTTLRPMTLYERGFLFSGPVLLLLSILAWWVLRRPYPIELSVDPSSIAWTATAHATQALTLRCYSHHAHRRVMVVPATLALQWELLEHKLPLTQGRPVRLRAHRKSLSERAKGTYQVRCRPGSHRRPSDVMTLELSLDPSCIDFTRIPRRERFSGVLKLTLGFTPKRTSLPIEAVSRSFLIAVDIDVREHAPQPVLTVRIFPSYRRLGADFEPGENPQPIGFVQVENQSYADGVARPVVIVSAGVRTDNREYEGATTLVKQVGASDSIESGATAKWRLEFAPPVGHEGIAPVQFSGAILIRWRDVRTDTTHTLQTPWAFTWVPGRSTAAGLDVGTSGTRLWIRRAENIPHERVLFPMAPINAGDTERVAEFPSAVLINDAGKVIRAGGGRHGVIADSGLNLRLVMSPKAQLLNMTTADQQTRARRDVSSYVDALARSWALARQQQNIGSVRLVVAVPWSFGRDTVRWFVNLLEQKLEGVALICPVREAEAAAYYHLLGQVSPAEASRARFAGNREHRVLVIDMGAGTTDYAVLSVKWHDRAVQSIQTIARTFSLAAGDRYDEQLLDLFDIADPAGRLAVDRTLRGTLLGMKVDIGNRLRAIGRVDIYDADLGQIRLTKDEYCDGFDAFFEEAITRPLRDLAGQLDQDAWLDEVLFAGRGVLAPGVIERIRLDARSCFDAAEGRPEIAIPQPQDSDKLHSSIAKGALLFEAGGEILLGDQDLAMTRDAMLILNLKGRPRVERLFAQGQIMNLPVTVRFDVDGDVREAWIVFGRPGLDHHAATELFGDLIRGGGDMPTAFVAGSMLRPPTAPTLSVQIDSDDTVRFVQ